MTAYGHCHTSGKKRLPDVDTAIHKALMYSARRGTPLRFYECPDCRGFHLTKRPAWHHVDNNEARSA